MFDSLFGPIMDKRYCSLFYILMIFFFICTVGYGIAAVKLIMVNKSRDMMVPLAMGFINCFFAYFAQRIMYSICLRSL
jgi:hypothetical protein